MLVRHIRAALGKSNPWDIVKYRSTSVTFKNGRRLNIRDEPADHSVVHQVFVSRDYDLSFFKQADSLLATYESLFKPLIIDCGANIGASSVWFAEAFGKAEIIAVEPDPANLKVLRSNVSERIEVVAGAVAGKSGEVSLFDPGQGGWAIRTVPGRGVPAYTVQELVENSAAAPFILKIDVEGFESDLFKNPCEVIQAFPLVIIELHDWMLPGDANSRPFLAWHAQHDRDFVFRGENVFSFRNERSRR